MEGMIQSVHQVYVRTLMCIHQPIFPTAWSICAKLEPKKLSKVVLA
jgi:hypothetical protein